MYIYTLTTYEYNAYSYDGIADSKCYYFLTIESAKRYAIDNKLKIVEYPTSNNHCTIERVIVNS